MSKRYFLILLLLLLVLPYQLLAIQKHAVVIGVGQQKDASWGRINVDKDVQCVCEILNRYAFNDIVVLRDKEATKQGIVAALMELASICQRDDVVYIHFSGHGQQMTDVDGDELDDGMDESWIPYDAYLTFCDEDNGSRHLCDDEINSLLSSIKKKVGQDGQILVVVDACHSGGSSRATEENIDVPVYRGTDKVFEMPSKGTTVSSPQNEEDWLILSACEDYQVNWEMKDPKMGKLTWCLYLLRDRLDSMTNEELKEEISGLMESPKMLSPLPQNPTLNGRGCIMDLFR